MMTHRQLRTFAIAGAAAVVLLATLAACAFAPVQTARAAVAASAALYGTSLQAFRVYDGLPRCKVAPMPCSDAVKALDMAQKLQMARAGVDRARDVVNLLPDQGNATAIAALPAGTRALLDDAASAAATADAAARTLSGVK